MAAGRSALGYDWTSLRGISNRPNLLMQRRLFLGAAGASVLSACTVTGFSSGKTETPLAPATAVLPPTAQPATQPVRIGLALGGGAARGFAHIGVIKMLEAQGIQIDFITGTSAGSVVAAIYASGMSGLEMNRMALKMDEAMIADWALPFGTRFGGWLKGEALEKYINRLVKQKSIEQMHIPLGIVATDLASGKPILFRRGNTGQAVRASCSIPGVFQPVTISGRQYVDGGLVAPVPVTYVKQMGATFVIAVNISADPSNQAVSGQASMLLQTTAIMGQSINKTELAQADVVITPSLPFVKGSDFTARNEAILAGEQAAQAAMPLLREKLHLTQTIVGTPLPPH